jgi:hypothetical protein
MIATVDRLSALATLRADHAKVQALLATESEQSLRETGRVRRGLFPGQGSSIQALIGHLQLWESIALEALHSFLEGNEPWICDSCYDAVEAGAKLNLDCDAHKREWSLQRSLQSWAQTAATLEAALAGLSDAQWRSAAPYSSASPEDLGGLLESLLTAPRESPFEHLANHLP